MVRRALRLRSARPGPPNSTFWLTWSPNTAAMCRNTSLVVTPGVQPAVEVVADRFADPEPRLAGRDGIDHVGRTDAARGAIEGAAAAGVRIGADQHGARQRVAAIGDDAHARCRQSAPTSWKRLMPNCLTNLRPVMWAPAADEVGGGARWSNTTMTLSGSCDLQDVAPIGGQERVSIRTEVSTSMTTMSPGATRSPRSRAQGSFR